MRSVSDQNQNQEFLYKSRKCQKLCVTAAKGQFNITRNNNISAKNKQYYKMLRERVREIELYKHVQYCTNINSVIINGVHSVLLLINNKYEYDSGG